MKKLQTACLSVIVVCALFCGCPNGLSDDVNDSRFIPNEADSALSGLTPEQRGEVKALYGCYWRDEKNSCTEIGDNGLILYSHAMSFRYTNLKWKKNSAAEWECTAFYKDDRDYADENKKVVLRFVTKESGVELYQHVVPMNQKLGPFTKGKTIEKIEEGGETFYVYDKNNYSGENMKMKVPQLK